VVVVAVVLFSTVFIPTPNPSPAVAVALAVEDLAFSAPSPGFSSPCP
jgi:hypothetical protein